MNLNCNTAFSDYGSSGDTAGLPGVTVIVPVYNGSATLERCLEALTASTPDNAKIVVVIDACTDGSLKIASRFPVRIIRNDRRSGASNARNRGCAGATSKYLLFIDADVVVGPETIQKLISLLEVHPELLGANGIFSLDISTPGLMSDFVNASLHFQHISHGNRVASAFTSVCMLRRDALEEMGWWDERLYLPYADDIHSRWFFSENSLALEPSAIVEHLKKVHLTGLCKHRMNVGFFFIRSLLLNRDRFILRPRKAVLHRRYPMNTLAAAILLIGVAAGFAGAAPGGCITGAALLLFLLANYNFVKFMYLRSGLYKATVSLVLSILEGFCFLFGMIAALAPVSGGEREFD